MKKYLLISLALLTSFFIIINSCKKDDDEQKDQTIVKGVIEGIVYAENGTTPIPLASVFLDYKEEVYFTQSDHNGFFSLTAPVGEHTLYIQVGQGNIFRTELKVQIVEDETTELPDMEVRIGQEAELAYISGTYDEIEYIVTEGLGYEITEIFVGDLNDLPLMLNYAAIFLNCNFSSSLNENQWTNLHSYVVNGGSLYVSDWAVNALIGNVGKFNNPDRSNHLVKNNIFKGDCFDRQGGFIPYDELCTERQGVATNIENADIESLSLSTWLGQETIDVHFDLPSWEVILNYGEIWEVLIADNSTDGFGPLAIRTNISSETIKSLTNNNNQEWITICHYPPGNPENAQTLTIPISAWPAFEALGATLGPCEGDGGNIIFTTFHNHPGEEICPDIESILEYFIFNL